ncbi:Competence-damage inducible protein CinA [Legionella moravica]|uniref:Competence-damage inducible protein CinA n=1 Tax=Legionella moravica TaxID=39962 RepID=A0A378JUX2_9GAMM|nr:CinA family protein [Legionella moravica]KTD32368.1 Competence-damage inducible protein CinA [Legionella moravica]STX62463.1 Competence-damage inducible protein CinA [Legionella moravica]
MNDLNALINEIASHLKNSARQMVTAESCTGGLIAAYLTEIPGSSMWFERGFVTYSNLAKQELLAVPEELLVQYGAVSEEVASSMAVGALRHSAGHVALSVTGIAGPDGGSIEKPVGTVCFGWAMHHSNPLTLKMQFAGTRHEIREAACRQALLGVLSLIKP